MKRSYYEIEGSESAKGLGRVEQQVEEGREKELKNAEIINAGSVHCNASSISYTNYFF